MDIEIKFLILFFYFTIFYLRNFYDTSKKEHLDIKLNNKYIAIPDVITETDYKILDDPLQDPFKRPARHVIAPLIGNPHLNIPTRGFSDSFSLQGYLVKNKDIFKLFGREKFPNSTEYEYYVEIYTNRDNSIKYELSNKRELYDGDEVYIDILKDNFSVKMLKTKGLEYNPYVI